MGGAFVFALGAGGVSLRRLPDSSAWQPQSSLLSGGGEALGGGGGRSNHTAQIETRRRELEAEERLLVCVGSVCEGSA